MQIRASWKQSLKLCTPANIKLFTLITLKSMLDVIRVLMVPWFLIPFGLLIVALCWVETGTIAAVCMQRLLILISPFIFILAARPSIGLKDGAYFKKNILRGLWIFFMYMILLLLFLAPILHMTIRQVYGRPSMLIAVMLVLLLFPCFLMSVFGNNFALLFYLDRTQNTWIAFKRAYLMIWYNLPAIAFYMFLAGVATLLISALVNFFLGALLLLGRLSEMSSGPHSSIIILINLLLEMMINLVYPCLATNLYIKLVHDQYELYFPEDAHKE